MKREALAALLVTAVLIAASHLGVTVFLGAHPLWSVRTGVIGCTGGLVVYAVLRLAWLRPTPLAIFGGLAGRFCFLGWFGVIAAACLTLSALAAVALRR